MAKGTWANTLAFILYFGAAQFKEQHKADQVAGNASCSREEVENGNVGESVDGLVDDQDEAGHCNADHTTQLVWKPAKEEASNEKTRSNGGKSSDPQVARQSKWRCCKCRSEVHPSQGMFVAKL